MINVVHLTDFHFASPYGILGAGPADSIISSALSLIMERRHRLQLMQGLDFMFYKRHDLFITRIVMDFVYSLMPHSHGVVLSGDLATRGSPADLQFAAKFILNKAAKFKGNLTLHSNPTFNTSNRPIIVVPGNHDRFRDVAGNAGGDNFDEEFGHLWETGIGGVQAMPVYGSEGDVIYFVAADLCLHQNGDSEPSGFTHCMGQGKCYPSTLERLNNACRHIRDEYPNAGIVFCIHFPPYEITAPENRDLDTRLKLIDYGAIIEMATEWDVPCILSGHLHETRQFNHGPIDVICCGSAAIMDGVSRNWVHEYGFRLDRNSRGRYEAVLSRANFHQLNYDTGDFEIKQPF